MAYDTYKTIEAISNIDFTGDLVPHSWFQHMLLPTGKADLLGIQILADIVFWYRKKSARHPGQSAKKFHGDMLQHNASYYAEKFRHTKRQIRDAIKRLETGGFIERQFRTVGLGVGSKLLGNLQYLAPIVTAIAAMQTHRAQTPLQTNTVNQDLNHFAEPSEDSSTRHVRITDTTNINAETSTSEFTDESAPELNSMPNHLPKHAEPVAHEITTPPKITVSNAQKPTDYSVLRKPTRMPATNHDAEQSVTNEHHSLDSKTTQSIANQSQQSLAAARQTHPQKTFRMSPRVVPSPGKLVDPIIGRMLTPSQISFINGAANGLAYTRGLNVNNLIDHISKTLLDPTCFTQASSDFVKKTNTIMKAIRDNPVGITPPTATKSSAAASAEQNQQQALQQELSHLLADLRHWQSLAKYAQTEQEIAGFKIVLTTCEKKLADFVQKHGLSNTVQQQ